MDNYTDGLDEDVVRLEAELEQAKAEIKKLRDSQRDCWALLENTTDFIYIKDAEHRFTCTSRVFASLTGHESWHGLVGKTDFDVFPSEHASRYFQYETPVIAEGKSLQNHEEPYYSIEGELRWVSSSKQPVFDDKGNIVGLVGISKDITDVKRYKAKIEGMAKYDQLTGMFNRYTFQDLGAQMLAAAKRKSMPLALLFIDLDNFKQVNDRYGHDCGDHLLTDFTTVLRNCTRDADIVARLGGDEFVTLIYTDQVTYDENRLAERIIHAFHQLPFVRQTDLSISCSVGIACFPDHASSLSELLTSADNAMYDAKKRGKDQWARFRIGSLQD